MPELIATGGGTSPADQARLDALESRIHIPAKGNVVVAIGDSNITRGQEDYPADTDAATIATKAFKSMPGWVYNLSVLGAACELCNGRARYAGSYGYFGQTTGGVFGPLTGSAGTGQLDRALAANPSVIVIQAGTNDATSGDAALAAAIANYKAGLAKIIAAGVTPVVTTLVPRNDTAKATAVKFNQWLVRYCRTLGVPVADIYRALVADSGGGYASGLNADQLHMNPAGTLAAAKVLAAVLRTVLPPVDPYVALTQGLTGDLNLFTNALFLTDTNSDGVADGVTAFSGATGTLITDIDHAKGKVQRFTRDGTGGFGKVVTAQNLGSVRGHKISMAMKLRSALQGGELQVTCYTLPNLVTLWRRNTQVDQPTGSYLLPFDFTWPSTPSTEVGLQLSFDLTGSPGNGAQIDIGEFTLLDLDAGVALT